MLDLVRFGNVRRKGNRFSAKGFDGIFGLIWSAWVSYIVHHDGGALLGITDGNRLADTSRRTGHNRYFIL